MTGGFRRVLLAVEIHRKYVLVQVGDWKWWPWHHLRRHPEDRWWNNNPFKKNTWNRWRGM